MGRFDTVVLASDNAGKLAELRALLTPLGIKLIAQGALGIASAEEGAITFIENALLKARHASRVAQLPAIADDSGIVVAALNGQPGVHSARYAGGHGDDDDDANNRKLLEALGDRRDRGAHFYCALVFVLSPTDPAPIVATGAWFGAIAPAARGTAGFGYDPLFIPEGRELTSAQLSEDEKNRISHRGQACAALRDLLRAALQA